MLLKIVNFAHLVANHPGCMFQGRSSLYYSFCYRDNTVCPPRKVQEKMSLVSTLRDLYGLISLAPYCTCSGSASSSSFVKTGRRPTSSVVLYRAVSTVLDQTASLVLTSSSSLLFLLCFLLTALSNTILSHCNGE